jgi:hypothetical protein
MEDSIEQRRACRAAQRLFGSLISRLAINQEEDGNGGRNGEGALLPGRYDISPEGDKSANACHQVPTDIADNKFTRPKNHKITNSRLTKKHPEEQEQTPSPNLQPGWASSRSGADCHESR